MGGGVFDEDLLAGVRDVSPLMLGVAPFALVAGIAAVDAGLGLAEAVGMSVIVFAGASQLAALELLGENAPLAVVVGTAAVINLRMLMYSASIAPHFADYGRRLRAGLAYLLTDQAYALSVAEFDENPDRSRWRYYLGAAASLWIVWQIGTVVGVVLGAGVPDAWGLTFAVPLVFLALLVPAMKDRPTTVAGVAGGAVAVVAAGLPLNLGLLVGALCGVAAGLVTEVRVS
ncbi:AzlC family ABC transporter permease [Halorubrum ezzemoulense]|uniref:Branched-chain amino acid ABC transporter permease n=2 Tax=Halorubrum ezzemoulense TaxID=337243 RepID=A0A1X4HAP6_HALEZ|nr:MULTISPECIES: AzlC family ABC transporter permease [Halorubrum]MDB2224770.1 AzlC family ABC transporter permease [Halorubrum ezzemoulense]MDB2237354.1 AzlC family ABC transporter permease [Halorubrum ezzemoulense]MDB2245349.1 AzlC family ABC transporter permease [Halorubrum ezzemoulense]MDB2246696.1 AzlC family ABC transporter permease [Halorubrum ezzemoulense]MDB2250235.1 AzlC family ABC transporter permease [Halorubrum ezzemoulense]